MVAELLEQQTRFEALLPRIVEVYSLIPDSESQATEIVQAESHLLSPLFAQLKDEVIRDLPVQEVAIADTHDAVAQVTAQCSQLLEERQKETRQFLRKLCYHVVNIRVRGEHQPQAMSAALESARRPLLAAVDRIVVPVEPVLTAELIAQSLPVIHEAVQQWLTTAGQTIANQLVLALHTLVEMDVVGIIEWPGERACKLHFFRHTVLQDRVMSQKTSTIRRVERNTLSIEEWEQLRARNRYSIERHEHHVMNAVAQELGQNRYPIPVEYQELMDAIPKWLRPHIRVLEGELILERIAQRLLREEHWDSQPMLRNAYEIEPAILLGHYVLTGWGQKEVERETYRRERERIPEPQPAVIPNKEALRESRQFQSLSNAMGAAAVTMMLFSRLQQRVMLPLSLLLSLMAVGLLWQSLQIRIREMSHGVDLIQCAYRIITLAFGLLAIQSLLFAILYGSWSMLGLSLPLAIVAFVTAGLAASRESI